MSTYRHRPIMGPQGLPICPRCGWQMTDEREHERTPSKCDQKAGKLAEKLVKESSVPATMHGYGTGRVTFKFNQESAITFDLRREVGTLHHVHWLADMDGEKVLEFVGKLAELVRR